MILYTIQNNEQKYTLLKINHLSTIQYYYRESIVLCINKNNYIVDVAITVSPKHKHNPSNDMFRPFPQGFGDLDRVIRMNPNGDTM